MNDTVSRRRFAAMAGGLAAAAIEIRRTEATRPNPTPSVEMRANVEWFLKDLFTRMAAGDQSWTDMVEPQAQVGLPATPVPAGIIAVPYVGFDLHDELEVRVVYSGLREEGGLSYDYLHLKTVNDKFVITEWSVRFPHTVG